MRSALFSDMHSLGEALARGTLKSAVQACPSFRSHIQEFVGKEVSKEYKNFCSLNNPSILRSVRKDAVVNFSWAAVSEELKNRAPLFYTVLFSGTGKNEDSLFRSFFGCF